MSEFNRDIEVIWGTAVDNTLGNKVKMTILATGFTMDDIPLIAVKLGHKVMHVVHLLHAQLGFLAEIYVEQDFLGVLYVVVA